MSEFFKSEPALHGTAFKPVYLKITGNLPTALILSQLVYWHKPAKNGQTKLKVKKDGKYWLAKSRTDWEAETGVSSRQYSRAITRLKDLQLIEYRMYIFGGKVTPHIRLNTAHLKELVDHVATGGKVKKCGVVVTKEANVVPIHRANLSQPIETKCPKPLGQFESIITDTTEDTTTETTFACATQTKDEELMKASELVKNLEAAKGAKKADTPLALSMVWKKFVSQEYECFVKNHTVAELGMLKGLITALGDKAHETVVWAVTHWNQFCYEVKLQKGQSMAPERPNLKFFVKHYEVAVQLIAKPVVVAVAVPAEPKPMAEAPKVEKPAKVSADAVLQAMQKLKGG